MNKKLIALVVCAMTAAVTLAGPCGRGCPPPPPHHHGCGGGWGRGGCNGWPALVGGIVGGLIGAAANNTAYAQTAVVAQPTVAYAQPAAVAAYTPAVATPTTVTTPVYGGAVVTPATQVTTATATTVVNGPNTLVYPGTAAVAPQARNVWQPGGYVNGVYVPGRYVTVYQ